MLDFFSLLGLPQVFSLDLQSLATAWKTAQTQVHPDKFANQSDAEKRLSMQWAVRVNDAYQTLKSPIKRATYLCELRGVPLNTESNTAMPAAFLMQQMEWHEDLEAANTIDGVESVLGALNHFESKLQSDVAQALDVENDVTEGATLGATQAATKAAGLVRQWLFVAACQHEAESKLEALQK